MATSGKPLDEPTRQRIVKLLREGRTRREIAEIVDVCKRTVDKVAAERNMGVSYADD